VLIEELGLEPGRTLHELEGAILRQDAELNPPGQAATPLGRRRRSGVMIAVGAAFLLSAALAVAGIELTGGESPGLSSASANSVAAIDARSNRLVAEIPVGNGPSSVAVGEGSVWVANALDRTVSRIDPETGGVVQRIDVGGDPGGIAAGAGAVWVANSLDGTVSRIDPQTNREVQAIPVGVTPTALAVVGGAVWVTSAEERSVTRIDVVRGRVVDRIATDALGRGIAVGGGSVWVTDESSRSVVRIDARRGSVVETVSVGNGPTGVAFGDGSVWVANSLDGTVSRIDPGTNRVTAVIPVGEGPDGIAVGPGVVWVSSEFSEAIARIDPAENRVVEQIPIANWPKGLALSEHQVWFAVQSSGAVNRGGRLVVAPGEFISGPIDPTFIYWTGTWSSLSTTYDGLVSPARRGGSEGAQIVPNLALSLPVITAGGTRYAFQLRRGVRYSNGTLVKASDFRRAYERAFRGGLPLEVPLVGADACERRPRSCDLSRGIRTDDATGTIVFHLRRPDGRFLRELIFLSVPIPRGTPDRDMGTRPVPSTGPYMIESYVPGRALTLVRNPYFRVRSRAARPDGFPDEIEFRLGGLSAGVTAVERGRVDVAFVPSDHKDVEALEDFKARHASQFHVHAEQATVLLFLNTARPPFDDARVRRAVNYAVDRGAISESYGPGFAQPTCQLRPPGTVGFRRYCPYTAAPSQTGEWKAPDLTRARRLVAASGTRGMRVTVWTYPGFWEQAAEGAVRALEELGYRASIRRAEGPEAYFAKAADEKTRGVQAGMSGLYGVPRTGSSLLTLLRCSPPDLSFFCDRRVDAQIARALRVEATDPDAAVALWARIERDIVDLAPWVPLFTPSHAFLASKRVGNYQYNPESRLLFDQLWVR
jgi:YVTN family beta-propeller protein